MFDKFTDSARKVLALARAEAQKLNHEYIGTEHMLLGILAIPHNKCTAQYILERLHVDPNRIREGVNRIVIPGPADATSDQRPFTPQAKRVLEAAIEIAEEHGHNYIGTEHLLPALARCDGIANEALYNLDITFDAIIQAFEEYLLEGGSVSDDTKAITPEELVQLTNQVLAIARNLVERLESIERKIEKVFPLPKPQPAPPPTSGHPNGAPISSQPPPNSGSFPITSPSENTTVVPCHACGQPMTRSGNCYKCFDCGETSGCS